MIEIQQKSDFHKYIEKIVECNFNNIKFENGKSIVMAVLDGTDNGYFYIKGSKDDATLAICELFHTISKMDSVLFCELFAEMLDSKNAELLYHSIRQRADFNSFDKD
jgi:hypothetical protein